MNEINDFMKKERQQLVEAPCDVGLQLEDSQGQTTRHRLSQHLDFRLPSL